MYIMYSRVLRRAPGAAPPERRLLPGAVAAHGEAQLLGHLGAEALAVAEGVLARVPAELQHRHDDGHAQAAEEHHEDAADVLHAQRVRLGVLALVLVHK